MKVDLHSHTSMSDGTLTPQELADFMGERGVELFSISDHDTLGAYGKFEPPTGRARHPIHRDQHDVEAK